MRNAASKLRDLQAALDIALGVGDGLAVLTGQHIGELVVVPLHQFDELHHHAGAALRIGVGPFGLGERGVLDRGADLSLGGQRHLGLHVAGHGLEHIGRPPGRALYFLAADEMSD